MRRGEPALAFDALIELGISPTMVEIAREGFRKTGEVLCPFVALLMTGGQPETTIVADDEFPAEVVIGNVPRWALDIYSRENRAAYGLFLQTDCASTRWMMRGHVSPKELDGHKLDDAQPIGVPPGPKGLRVVWPTP